VSTLLHATVYVFTQSAEYTSTRCKLNWITKLFLLERPNLLQSVIIHSANGGKGEGCHVEEYSAALLC
jgi:hypothetical protein